MLKQLLPVLLISSSLMGFSQKNKQSGKWISLFDGKSLKGWHNYGKTTVGDAWQAEKGILHLNAAKKEGWQIKNGGDIVSEKAYSNFHLKLDWKIAKNGNSGIIFYVNEDTAKYKYPWNTGPEMQVLDNAGHPDSKIFKHRAGDLYDLIPCKTEVVKPAGVWNKAEIISLNGQLTLILNGTKVVETKLWDEAWQKLIAGSKFKEFPDFGKFKTGKIALQDHGDDVWYKNIVIKEL